MLSSYRMKLLGVFLATVSCGYGWNYAWADGGTSTLAPNLPLQGASAVLRQLDTPQANGEASTPKAFRLQFSKDLQAYQTGSAAMKPEAAAQGWLHLVDRAYQAQTSIGAVVPFRKLLAVLPPPAQWNALSNAINARVNVKKEKSKRDLALVLLGHVLTANKTAMEQDKVALRTKLTAEKRYAKLIQSLEDSVALATGAKPPLNIIVDDPHSASAQLYLPDLVTLEGKEKATARLRQILLTTPKMIGISVGDETRELARKLALELAPRLVGAQWVLAQSSSQMALFEAMEKRFGQSVPKVKNYSPEMTRLMNSTLPQYYKEQRRAAQASYLTGLIIHKRTREAVELATRLGRTGGIEYFCDVYEIMQSGHLQELNTFLHDILVKNPDLNLWNAYISTSVRTKSSGPMIDLLQKAAARKGLAPAQMRSIRSFLTNAYLAIGRVNEGVAILQQEISAPSPHKARDAAPDINGNPKVTAAVQLLRVGRLMNRRDWEAQAITVLQAYRPQEFEYWMVEDTHTRTPIQTLLDLGYDAVVEKIFINRLKKAKQLQLRDSWGGEDYSYTVEGTRTPLVELAGLYARKGKYDDVLLLLDKMPGWGTKDLASIYTLKASTGAPLGYIAAGALAQKGDKERAITILKSTLFSFGGYDPAYELLTSLMVGDEAIAFLDQVYRGDQFEERPLIWKAALQLKAGKLEEAEKTVRAAIAIDPSDGEQGKGDRMRAYTVLADIREARGDSSEAGIMRGAVKAIRLSEDADDWQTAGLLSRAIGMYEKSLTYFSDAYCIQSRLAIQLNDLGRTEEAEAHYRRAFELMPDSFGRMESHCFGCSGVFSGFNAESMAEQVFQGLVKKEPQKPQLHYLLGYLRMMQGKAREALPYFRKAVQLDPDYINAWQQIANLRYSMELPAADREAAAFNLLRLDPQGRHVQPQLDSVSNLRELWTAVDKSLSYRSAAPPKELYPLAMGDKGTNRREEIASEEGDGSEGGWADEVLTTQPIMDEYGDYNYLATTTYPGQVLARHKALAPIVSIMDERTLNAEHRNAFPSSYEEEN